MTRFIYEDCILGFALTWLTRR